MENIYINIPFFLIQKKGPEMVIYKHLLQIEVVALSDQESYDFIVSSLSRNMSGESRLSSDSSPETGISIINSWGGDEYSMLPGDFSMVYKGDVFGKAMSSVEYSKLGPPLRSNPLKEASQVGGSPCLAVLGVLRRFLWK